MKRKWERLIQNNLDLEIPMHYSVLKKKSYFPYVVLSSFLLLFLFSITKINAPIQLKQKDSILINVSKSVSVMDITRYMYESEKKEKKNIELPFFSIKWRFEYDKEEYTISSKDETTFITIKDKNSVLREKELFKMSMINQVPVEIHYNGFFYQAWLEKDDFIYQIWYNLDEKEMIALLKQLLGGDK